MVKSNGNDIEKLPFCFSKAWAYVYLLWLFHFYYFSYDDDIVLSSYPPARSLIHYRLKELNRNYIMYTI